MGKLCYKCNIWVDCKFDDDDAEKLIEQVKKTDNLFNIDFGLFYDFEHVIESEELITPEENENRCTIQIINDEGQELYDNAIEGNEFPETLYYTVDYANLFNGFRNIDVYKIVSNKPIKLFELTSLQNDEGFNYYSDEEEIQMYLDEFHSDLINPPTNFIQL